MDPIRPGDNPGELKIFDHGFVRLDSSMADDLSVVNSARVSFAVRKDEMDDKDKGLIKFLMRDQHGTPFEHNSFRFHIRCPIFVAREWFRHRVGCLTGDTLVTFVNINGSTAQHLRKTIDELWDMWTVGEVNGHRLSLAQEQEIKVRRREGEGIRAIAREMRVGRRAIWRVPDEGGTQFRSSRSRMLRMRLRVLNEDTNEFEVGRLAGIVKTGVQPVYRVTLADGKQLSLTENHRVLTDQGWQSVGQALGLEGRGVEAKMTRSAKFITNGLPVYQDPAWLQERRNKGLTCRAMAEEAKCGLYTIRRWLYIHGLNGGHVSRPGKKTGTQVEDSPPALYANRQWMQSMREKGLGVQDIADQASCSYHTARKWLRIHGLQFGPNERGFRKGFEPWNKGKSGYKLNKTFTEESLAAIRAARSGPRSNWWRGGITPERGTIARWTSEHAARVHYQYDFKCQVADCPGESKKLHAHHIIPVWLDASKGKEIGNLITLCRDCHERIHRSQATEMRFMKAHSAFVGKAKEIGEIPSRKGCKLSGHPVRVASVEYSGLRETFDLNVEGEWHNFVANGVVVHNSFNEESARYHKLSDDFYLPEPESVRSQVGKPGSYTFEPVEPTLAEETRSLMRSNYKAAYDSYLQMIEKGVAKELARAVLPFGIYTQFYWTLNARSLMNFIALRNSETAQYEIRIFAQAIEQFFAEKMPVTHECFIESGRTAP